MNPSELIEIFTKEELEQDLHNVTKSASGPALDKKKIKHWSLNPGWSWNPLLKLPRNMPCPCDSGKKFKHCHLVGMPRAIPEKIAKDYKASMKQFELIKFVEEDDEKATQPNP